MIWFAYALLALAASFVLALIVGRFLSLGSDEAHAARLYRDCDGFLCDLDPTPNPGETTHARRRHTHPSV